MHHGEFAFASAESQGILQAWNDFRHFRAHRLNLEISGSAHLITFDSHILMKSRDNIYIYIITDNICDTYFTGLYILLVPSSTPVTDMMMVSSKF